jgi:curli biogenesis system outer membrane secretion channel CsgG
LFDSGDYKNAYNLSKKSLSYGPDNSMAAQLFSDAKEKLTVRLAVFPFSSSKLDQKFGNIASQTILSRALPRRSEFVQFLDRENLQKVFEEQALSQTGAIDEKTAVEVGKISGVNTIVVGSVTLVSHQKTQPTRRALTGYYDKSYRDPKGVQRTKKEPFSYTAFEVSNNVEVNISYRLISVETGAILANESINRQATDAAEWIICPENFVQHLPYSERQKLKASKEPKNLESLINQAIESLTNDAASKILNKVSPF